MASRATGPASAPRTTQPPSAPRAAAQARRPRTELRRSKLAPAARAGSRSSSSGLQQRPAVRRPQRPGAVGARPDRRVPIASLTKMMTALVVVAHARPTRPRADHQRGAPLHRLRRRAAPAGQACPLEHLLYGLLLPSGNDAAIALAAACRRHAGALHRDDERPGARDGAAVHPLHDRLGDRRPGQPLVRRAISRWSPTRCSRSRCWRGSSPRAARSLPFPIKGGKLYLYNNNPLLLLALPGHRRRQDRLHGRGRPVPGGNRPARAHMAGGGAAALGQTPRLRRSSCSTPASPSWARLTERAAAAQRVREPGPPVGKPSTHPHERKRGTRRKADVSR